MSRSADPAAAVAGVPAVRFTIVLKVGSSSLATADGKHLNLPTLAKLVEAICDLRRSNIDVVLVTSGAVAVGCQRMRLAERPKDLITKQAVAAIGQGRLMRVYDDLFSQLEQPVAQVLLSRENLNKQHHYTNALNTLRGLLRLGVVPIINENDTVAVEELRFGDNDTLSALVASLLEAEWLFLLTDVDSLYTADPRKDPSARPIRTVRSMDEIKADVGASVPSGAAAAAPAARVAPALSPSAPFSSAAAAVPSASGTWGTGGMATKLTAASIATRAGVRTVIIKSTEPSQIKRIIIEGGCEKVGMGTEFYPQERPIKGKKKWIAHGMRPDGTLVLDVGAAAAVKAHSSLFAAGIAGVIGEFSAQSCVILTDLGGKEIARGVVAYSSAEIELIRGKNSAQYADTLGYLGSEEVITRDNLAITTSPAVASPPPSAAADSAAGAGQNPAAHSS